MKRIWHKVWGHDWRYGSPIDRPYHILVCSCGEYKRVIV